MMRTKTQFDETCRNIRELVYSAALRCPENDAFKIKKSGGIYPITFAHLVCDMEALGTELLAQGFSGGCRMGIIGENSYPWYSCFLSIVCGGNVAVPFDKELTVGELESSIARSGIRLLFFDERHEGLIQQVRAGGRVQVEKYILIDGEGSGYDSMIDAGGKRIQSGDNGFRGARIDENALAVLLFTSGTTSRSKAVMLSHYNIVSNVIDMYNYEAFYEDDVNMAFLPFHHSFGLVGTMVFLGIGACSVFCDGLKYVTKNLKEYGVTVFVGVPLIVENMYSRILREIRKKNMAGRVKFGLALCRALDKIGLRLRRKVFRQIIDELGGRLRLIICGAAPLSGEVAQGMNDFGILLIQGYGLTETSPVVAAESHEFRKAGSVGRPMPRVDIRIEDADAEGIGEIAVKGPNVMLGYMDQPEETEQAIRDGWFFTGDLGTVDEEGFLWIKGRSKNVIVMKNGKNIFPEEIEAILSELPYVEESLVFTREKHNELVLWAKLLYSEDYLRENGITEEELRRRAEKDVEKMNNRLPGYKQLNHFFLSTDPMIMTTTQKVKRDQEIKKILLQFEEKQL